MAYRKGVGYFGLGYQARLLLPELWQQRIAFALLLLLFLYSITRRSSL